MFDAVTGEAVGASFEAPDVLGENSRIGPNSVSSTETGSIEAVGLGTQHLYLFNTIDGVVEVVRIPPPFGAGATPKPVVGLELSPNGTYLSLHVESDVASTYWLLNLRTEDAQWIEIPSNSDITSYFVRFVQGTGI